MFARLTRRSTVLAMAALLPLAVACSDDDPTGPVSDGIVGRWRVVSYHLGGMNVLEQGVSMEFRFTADGWSVTVSGDPANCETPSCTETGTYALTSTRITIDPGTEHELELNYAMQGSRMTFTGDVEGFALIMILQRS